MTTHPTLSTVLNVYGRTQAELAALIGKSRASDLWRGNRLLTRERLIQLHTAWGIPMELLFWTTMASVSLPTRIRRASQEG